MIFHDPINKISSWRQLISRFSVTVAFVIISLPAYAEPVGPFSDISGLHLGTPRAVAIAKLASLAKVHHTIRGWAETSYYRMNLSMGEEAYVPNSPDSDEYTVTYYPGTDHAVSVIHKKDYPASGRPLLRTMLSALSEKYGQPNLIDGKDYYWFSNKNLLADESARFTCILNLTNYEAFWSSISVAAYGDDDLRVSVANYHLNNYRTNSDIAIKLPLCGQILHYQIQPSSDGDHVSWAAGALIDFPATLKAATIFADDFWQKEKQAREAKLRSDSAITPAL